jgi:VanZ family protein
VRIHAVIWRTTAVAWACLIFYLSTGTFGGTFTEALLRLILQSLRVTVTPHVFQTVHFLFRKLAHLTEYAIFAMLVYGSGREADPFRWLPERALWSLIIVGIYSATDEFHQSFVPGRGPPVVDSAIDTTGAALGMLLFYFRAMRLQIASSRAAASRESALEK